MKQLTFVFQKIHIALLLICILGIYSAATCQEKQREYFPGTRLSFIKPKDFNVIYNKAAFYDPKSGAVIEVEEVPLPFDSLFTKDNIPVFLKAGKYDNMSSPRDTVFEGLRAKKFVYQTGRGLLVNEWRIHHLLVAGDSVSVAVINIHYPDSLSEKDIARITSLISTVRWDRKKLLNVIDLNDFSIEEKGDFKLASENGYIKSYTPGGVKSDTEHIIPRLSVLINSVYRNIQTEKDQRYIIESILSNLPGLTVQQVAELNKVNIDNIDGLETISPAVVTAAGAADSTLIIYFTVLFHPQGAIEFVGMARSSDKENIESFRQMTHSFTRKRSGGAPQTECAALLEKKKYAEAEQCFSEALQKDSASQTARVGLADIRRLKGKSDEALAMYNRIIDSYPKCAEAYVGRGAILTAKDQVKKSIEDINAAINLNPGIAEAYYQRGLINEKNRDFTLAKSDFEQATKLSPKYIEAYMHRADMMGRIEGVKAGIEGLDDVLSVDSAYAPAYAQRGMAHAGLLQYRLAMSDFNRALRFDPALSDMYFQRGMAHSALEEHEAAIKDFDAALKTKASRSVEVLTMRGWEKVLLGRFDEALKDLDAGIKRDTNNTFPRMYRAFTYFMTHKYDKAIKDLQKTIGAADASEAETWLYVSVMLQYNSGVAEKGLKSYDMMQGALDDAYPGLTIRYLLGKTTEEKLLAAARKADEDRSERIGATFHNNLSLAYFAIGLAQYGMGLKSAAKKYWSRCVETNVTTESTYGIAKAYLKGLWK